MGLLRPFLRRSRRISADAVIGERIGAAYYTARIAFDPGEIGRLGDVKLVPGMPVEVFVITGDRKVISCLMKPITEQLARALRER